MSKFIKSKKGIALLATLIVAVAAAVGAYAYWTTSGSGSGSATAASSNGTVTLHASFDDDPLYPGGSVPVSFSADSSSDSKLYVGTISATVSTDPSTCSAADFHMADVTSNTIVNPHADDQDVVGEGTLYFDNSDLNQDDCKGATITLNLSSN